MDHEETLNYKSNQFADLLDRKIYGSKRKEIGFLFPQFGSKLFLP